MKELCEICKRRISDEIRGCERETIPSSAPDNAETLGIRLDCYVNGFQRLEDELLSRCAAAETESTKQLGHRDEMAAQITELWGIINDQRERAKAVLASTSEQWIHDLLEGEE